MSQSDKPLDLEAFRVQAVQAGLVLKDDELALMYQGYLGLQTLLGRLPREPALLDEPAVVFVPPGAEVVR